MGWITGSPRFSRAMFWIATQPKLCAMIHASMPLTPGKDCWSGMKGGGNAFVFHLKVVAPGVADGYCTPNEVFPVSTRAVSKPSETAYGVGIPRTKSNAPD